MLATEKFAVLVTGEDVDCLLLNVVQSVLLKYPFVLEVAWLILIVGVSPPDDEIGKVPLTELTYDNDGISLETSARNVGAAAPPDVAPAKT